jgi:hypothetical protein
MRFLMYGTELNPLAGGPPSPETMAQLGQLTLDSQKSGVLIATGGLMPQGTRLRLSGGTFTVTDGPFIEAKELIAGWALLQVNSKEEAIEWAKKFRTIVGDGESEIVQVFGVEDFA